MYTWTVYFTVQAKWKWIPISGQTASTKRSKYSKHIKQEKELVLDTQLLFNSAEVQSIWLFFKVTRYFERHAPNKANDIDTIQAKRFPKNVLCFALLVVCAVAATVQICKSIQFVLLCELYGFEIWVTLNLTFQGHLMSNLMVWLEYPYMTSYP